MFRPKTVLTPTRRISTLEEAPEHLQNSSPHLHHGYRVDHLSLGDCVFSLFSWHNETLSIWSHLLSTFYCGLLLWDIHFPEDQLQGALSKLHWLDHWILFAVVVIATLTFTLSTTFHLFSCMSAQAHDLLLSCDLAGVLLLILAFFFSGLYFGFYFHPEICLFYMATVTLLSLATVGAVVLPRWRDNRNLRVFLFSFLAAYGFVPMFHWIYIRPSAEVTQFLPMLLQMYGWSFVGFLCYYLHVPERWFPKNQFVALYCNSHAFWHVFVTFSAITMHNVVVSFVHYLKHLV